MSLAQTLSTYLALNLMVVVAYLALRVSAKIGAALGRATGARATLRLHYALLAILVTLAAIHPLLPKKQIFQPAVKVWSAHSLKTFSTDYTDSEKGGYLALPARDGSSVLQADQVSLILLVICSIIVAFAGVRVGRDLFQLRRIRRQSYLMRRIGAVFILANDQIRVPFSYWVPWRAVVVIPTVFMARPGDRKVAIAHELQHHRQSDTKWVYAMWVLRALCAINPFVHLWSRWLSEIQEFACDETLVDQNKVESRQYARCLIEVAETALNQKCIPACAMGLVFLVERNLLKRRVEQMLNPLRTKVSRSISWSVGGIVVALMAATAFASQTLVQDRRVSLDEAKAMALRAQRENGIPVVVNELVLKELNRYVGTPEGREFIRQSLQRMEKFRATVEGKITEYDVPAELMAIPLMESGYQNLPQKSKNSVSAGLWQFVPDTARNFGLRVDNQVDDRLNVSLETDAAMRLLKADKLQFNDWHLSIMAYNMGESAVNKAIRATGSRDAWTLIHAGYENDQRYLAKVMAAILIMRNPESVAQ